MCLQRADLHPRMRIRNILLSQRKCEKIMKTENSLLKSFLSGEILLFHGKVCRFEPYIYLFFDIGWKNSQRFRTLIIMRIITFLDQETSRWHRKIERSLSIESKTIENLILKNSKNCCISAFIHYHWQRQRALFYFFPKKKEKQNILVDLMVIDFLITLFDFNWTFQITFRLTV